MCSWAWGDTHRTPHGCTPHALSLASTDMRDNLSFATALQHPPKKTPQFILRALAWQPTFHRIVEFRDPAQRSQDRGGQLCQQMLLRHQLEGVMAGGHGGRYPQVGAKMHLAAACEMAGGLQFELSLSSRVYLHVRSMGRRCPKWDVPMVPSPVGCPGGLHTFLYLAVQDKCPICPWETFLC